MTVTVRIAAADDYAAIADLTTRVYVDEGFSPATAEASLRDVDERARQTRLWCAVDTKGRVLGAVSLVPNGSAFSQIGGPSDVEVRLLAVEPATRGAGVGEQLMRACIEEARAEGLAIVLSTQTTMLAAQRLYERLGFTREPSRDWTRASGPQMLAYTLDAPGA